jgi:membrane protease YdiL (CAAX protease family)
MISESVGLCLAERSAQHEHASHNNISTAIELKVASKRLHGRARPPCWPLLSYGYRGEHRLARFLSGVLSGFLCLSMLVAVLWKCKLLILDGISLRGYTAWSHALGWGFAFLLVGFFEESLLRGYLQYTLTRGIGFWWSALLLSIVFALGHVGNNGETVLGIIEVGTGGLIFCLSFWYTKSLWWAVGFHAGWDWGQSFFYGTPDSGLLIRGHLLAAHPSGNPLSSGGTDGPEGRILILPLVAIVAIGMWLWWGVKQNLPESGGILANEGSSGNR